MEDFVKALQIIMSHDPETRTDRNPFNCEHDTLYIMADETKFPPEVIKMLDDLGVFPNKDDGGFISYRFGSC